MKAFSDTIWRPGEAQNPGAKTMSPTELSERLLYLEKQLAKPDVDNVPLADLQRKLSQVWLPDPVELLPKGSITAELIAPGTLVPLLDAVGVTVAGPSGAMNVTTAAVWIPLTGGPTVTIPRDGVYLVAWELGMQSLAAGLFQANASIGKNGTFTGPFVFVVGYNTFEGGSVTGFQLLTLAKNDVLTILCSSNNTLNTNYFSGVLVTIPVSLT